MGNTIKHRITAVLFASSVSYMHGLEDSRFLQRQCWPQVAWEPGLCYGCRSVAAARHCTRASLPRRRPSPFHPSRVQINPTKAVTQLPRVVSAQEFPFPSRHAVCGQFRGGAKERFPLLASGVGGFAVEESFVLQVGGTDRHSGERVRCYRAPSSLPKEGDAGGRTGDGGMSST